MPYNPSQNYIGGQLLATGIGNVGEGLAKGFEQYQKAQKEHEGDQFVIDYALKTGMLTPEQHTQYLNGSRSQKNDVVAGLVRTFAMDQARKQEERLTEQARLEGNVLKARAAEGLAGAGGGFNPQVTTLIDPATGQPFSVYSRGPNQVDLTPGSAANARAGQPVIHPETGKVIGIYGPKGDPRYFARETKPDPINEAIAEQIRGTSPAATPPVNLSQSESAPTATPAADKVRVKSPIGVIGTIPRSNLEAAKAAGFVEL